MRSSKPNAGSGASSAAAGGADPSDRTSTAQTAVRMPGERTHAPRGEPIDEDGRNYRHFLCKAVEAATTLVHDSIIAGRSHLGCRIGGIRGSQERHDQG